MKRVAVSAILVIAIVAAAAALALPGAADSLWPADRTASPYADKKAHAVGDLLTVIIVQSSIAAHEAESETEKSASASADEGTGLLKFFPDLGFSVKRSSQGSGSTIRKTQLADHMTARVVEVLENGVLRIEGARSTIINEEKLECRLTGIIRPQDVAPDNTVLSTAIADQKLEWTGKGPVAEKQRPGIISQLLRFLF